MKKTSMVASALLNLIIQLSQYYEEKSPLLYTLVVCTFRHLPWWPLHTKTWFSYYTHIHTGSGFLFFMLPNCEWALCGSARDELFHTKNTSTQTCRKWTQRHAHADAYSQTHANITPKCWKLTSSQLLRACLPLACSHTPLSFTHHHHPFHQRCIFSNFIH